jgi:glycerol-3-phosphate dehydrogenase
MRVSGAVLRDGATGEQVVVHARVVLSAAGVWTDELVAMATGSEPGRAVRRSKGVHLVIPRSTFQSSTAVIARTPHSVLFLLPWSEHWLVGTTDTDYDGSLESPGVTIEDVDYLLGQANRWLARPLDLSDVVGVFAGLRPLLSSGQGDTTELSREHAVMRPVPGFVAIAGGKYTTYRAMARDAVDAIAEQLPGEVPGCTTDEIPLVGAEGYRAQWAARVRRARTSGLDVVAVERLLRRHGDRTEDVLALVAADPALGRPLHAHGRVIRAEAIVAARDEGARSLADILVRRTRLAVQTRDRALSCARDTAALVAPILGWDADRVEAEIAALLAAQPEVPTRAE